MQKLVAGNWKMHGLAEDAAALARAVRPGVPGVSLLVCPPFTQIAAVAAILAGSPVTVGGQDCHTEPEGPHTGDISAPMLRDAGCRFVILGHSERRAAHHETDALVHAKAVAAAAAGLTAVVCVGESEAERSAGREAEIVGAQLGGSLPPDFAGVVAYEPVWAIGTGRTPRSDEIARMHALIRRHLAARFGAQGNGTLILYGGSVKPENAAPILALPEVGGALVGGASLVARDFLAIAAAAA